jgi:hypothetical protein
VTEYDIQGNDTNYIGKNRLAAAIDAIVATLD